MMSTKTDALAARFEQASNDFAYRIQGLNDNEWQSRTRSEGWTVAATAHHAAGSIGPISMIVQSAATGSPPMSRMTIDGLNEMNAEHAKQYANVTRKDTLILLRETTSPAADLLRGLNDDQLQRKAILPFGMELTAEQIIENVLIGHITSHVASIRRAQEPAGNRREQA